MPETPDMLGGGIISKAEGAAGQAKGTAAATPAIGTVEGATTAAGATVSGVAAAGTAVQEGAQPAIAGIAVPTGAAESAVSPLGSASGAAREGAAGIAAGKELPTVAQDLAKQKAETAALGTKGREKLEQAKALEEEVAKKRADLQDAKETAEKAGKVDDSADIEE